MIKGNDPQNTQSKNKIFIASDHAAFNVKEEVKTFLKMSFSQYELTDMGCDSINSVDYPDFAEKVARAVVKESGLGILICGSGLGMCISANKIRGIRATNAWDVTSAKLGKEHNNSNVLCLGARLTGVEVIKDAITVWLKTSFAEGRHSGRVLKISELEKAL